MILYIALKYINLGCQILSLAMGEYRLVRISEFCPSSRHLFLSFAFYGLTWYRGGVFKWPKHGLCLSFLFVNTVKQHIWQSKYSLFCKFTKIFNYVLHVIVCILLLLKCWFNFLYIHDFIWVELLRICYQSSNWITLNEYHITKNVIKFYHK